MNGCDWCEVIEVAPRIYAVIDKDGGWFRNNSGLVDMGDYTLVIDTQYNEARTRDLAKLIEKLELPRKCLLVNTHHHGDHAWGNHLLGCTSIMHKKALEVIKFLKDLAPDIYKPFFPQLDFTGSKYTLPEIATSGELHLIGEKRKAIVKYAGPAHTIGDLTVEFPNEKVLFAGDLVFNKVTPLALDGTVGGWIATLSRLSKEYKSYKIVGGHGPVADSSIFELLRKYFRHILEGTKMLYEKNIRDPYDIAIKLTNGPLEGWKEKGRLVLNIARALMDLNNTPPGTPVEDLPVLAQKMYQYESR